MGKATEKLRILLDRHKVHWMEIERFGVLLTCWKLNNRQETHCYFNEYAHQGDELIVSNVIPEQVIDMTLDRTAKVIVMSNGATGRCRCGSCKKRIDPWDKYCRHCGARLEVER